MEGHMATYNELQTRVQHIVIDLPVSVTAQVPTLVKEAVRKLQTKHDFEVCKAVSSVYTTTIGERVLTPLPSNWNKWRGKPVTIEPDGSVLELGVFSDRFDAEREWGSELASPAEPELIMGPPRGLLLSEPTDELGTRNVEVYPLPDGLSLYTGVGGGEYRIVLPYWRFLTTLTNSTDQNWFTNNAEEWIVFMAAAGAFFLDWDEDRGTLWTQRASAEWKDILLRDKYNKIAQITEIVPHRDARGHRGQSGDLSIRRRIGF
jgi:hypothetical protein